MVVVVVVVVVGKGRKNPKGNGVGGKGRDLPRWGDGMRSDDVIKGMSNLNTADRLNNLERLILAQAVYELGSNAWAAVSDILSQHPLIINRDDLAFSPNASPFFGPHVLVLILLVYKGMPEYI